MAKLTNTDKELILADYKAGVSQNQLAKRYNLSPATINKICKGIEQDNAEIVNSQIAILTELQSKSEYEVNAIHKAVDEGIRNKNLVFGVTQKALKKLDKMLDSVDSINDIKTAIEASDRASLTLKVNERHTPKSETKVDVSQTNAVQFNIDLGND